jgi:hypothetical protein
LSLLWSLYYIALKEKRVKPGMGMLSALYRVIQDEEEKEKEKEKAATVVVETKGMMEIDNALTGTTVHAALACTLD